MTTKTLLSMIGAASLLAVGSAAHAALVPLDAWQIDTGNGTNTASTLTTDIGHLNLSGGSATVEQAVTGAGGTEPAAGDPFAEVGIIYTISYTPESTPGLGDSGSPTLFNGGLTMQLRFTGLTGTVASYDSTTGAIEYDFNPGGSVGLYGSLDDFATEDLLASLTLVDPSGGDLSDFTGIGDQSQGQSTISQLVTSSLTDLFRDSLGNSLDPEIAAGNLFGLAVTTNKVSDPGFQPTGPCSFNASLSCVTGTVTSDGSFDLLVQRAPEPVSLALMGVGLVAMGQVRRRRRRV